jgi:hypothetical protein
MQANGQTLDLNGHSILGDGSGFGIAGSVGGLFPNNATIQGPGVIHNFETCIRLGAHALVSSVLVYDCNGEDGAGIWLGNFSKCVQCRVHNVFSSEGTSIGIILGNGCLLEASIVATSDFGARVGHDCKVWDLVVDSVEEGGLKVGSGTAVARTVISHCHNGPGIDYCDCGKGEGVSGQNNPFPRPGACVDSSNAVTSCNGNNIADSTQDTAYGFACIYDTPTPEPVVVTGCGTVVDSTGGPIRYPGVPLSLLQCDPAPWNP